MTCRAYLEAIHKLMPQHFGTSLLLQHGRSWPFDPKFRPPMRYATRKACFTNALRLVVWRPEKYTYVEGFAHTGLLPVEHAWCLDAQGRVVDPTWHGLKRHGPSDYFGIPFRADFVFELAMQSDRSGVLENPLALFQLLDWRKRPQLWLGSVPKKVNKSKKKTL